MARIRSVHPDACKSRKLDTATAEAERCYWRLQPHCDDDGRCEDDPTILRSLMFTVREHLPSGEVDGWLQELHDLGLIIRYQVAGKRYLQVTRWADYQKPQKKTASKLPPLPGSPTPLPEGSATATGEVWHGEGVGEGELSCAPPTSGAFEAEFESWYASYPRKKAKPDALKAYRARRRAGRTVDELNSARDRFAAEVRRDGKALEYVPYPASFLNKQIDDYLGGAAVNGKPEPARPTLGAWECPVGNTDCHNGNVLGDDGRTRRCACNGSLVRA